MIRRGRELEDCLSRLDPLGVKIRKRVGGGVGCVLGWGAGGEGGCDEYEQEREYRDVGRMEAVRRPSFSFLVHSRHITSGSGGLCVWHGGARFISCFPTLRAPRSRVSTQVYVYIYVYRRRAFTWIYMYIYMCVCMTCVVFVV